MGVVVLPSQLLQLLRPFVPRTTDFDAKFAEVFSQPQFRAAHSDFAKIIQRVLQFLASVKGISQETAVAILADEVLLRRLMEVESDHEIKEIIESEILQRNATLYQQQRELKGQLEDLRSESDRQRDELERRERQLRERENALTRQTEALRAERSERTRSQAKAEQLSQQAQQVHIELTTVTSQKAKVTGELEETERKLKEVEQRLSSMEQTREKHSRLIRSLAFAAFTLAGWLALVFFSRTSMASWINQHPHHAGLYLAAGLMVPAIVWSLFGWKGRLWALGVVAIGILLQLIQVL